MISICIPVYNFDVRDLVNVLAKQIDSIESNIEILIIDDASADSYKRNNKEVSQKCVTYIELESNIGRAAIRNRFLQYANNEHLLFLDCDGMPVNSDFLTKYLSSIESDVVVGGRIYGEKPDDVNLMLRWKFGVERESKSASQRQGSPYKSFMTNNFMVTKKLIKELGFNEELKGYGHEDTLFGHELFKQKMHIKHIENPVLNCHLETSSEFLSNTKQGVKNIHKIYEILNHDSDFVQSVSLLRVWKKSKPFSGLIRNIYALFEQRVVRNLKGGNPNLRAFDIYKLVELMKIDRSVGDSA